MKTPNRENCLNAARKWWHKYWAYRTKWEFFKRQQNETAATAIYYDMVVALDNVIYLTKKAEQLAH